MMIATHTDHIHTIAWSPDGKRLVSGSSDETARVWDAETGEWVWTLAGHTQPIETVAWSPDSTHFAGGVFTTFCAFRSLLWTHPLEEIAMN